MTANTNTSLRHRGITTGKPPDIDLSELANSKKTWNTSKLSIGKWFCDRLLRLKPPSANPKQSKNLNEEELITKLQSFNPLSDELPESEHVQGVLTKYFEQAPISVGLMGTGADLILNAILETTYQDQCSTSLLDNPDLMETETHTLVLNTHKHSPQKPNERLPKSSTMNDDEFLLPLNHRNRTNSFLLKNDSQGSYEPMDCDYLFQYGTIPELTVSFRTESEIPNPEKIKRNVRNVLGKRIRFVGEGKNLREDIVFLREKLKKLRTNSPYFESVRVRLPCSILSGNRKIVLYDRKEPELGSHAIDSMLPVTTSTVGANFMICVIDERGLIHSHSNFIVKSGFLSRLIRNPKEYQLLFLLDHQKQYDLSEMEIRTLLQHQYLNLIRDNVPAPYTIMAPRIVAQMNLININPLLYLSLLHRRNGLPHTMEFTSRLNATGVPTVMSIIENLVIARCIDSFKHVSSDWIKSTKYSSGESPLSPGRENHVLPNSKSGSHYHPHPHPHDSSNHDHNGGSSPSPLNTPTSPPHSGGNGTGNGTNSMVAFPYSKLIQQQFGSLKQDLILGVREFDQELEIQQAQFISKASTSSSSLDGIQMNPIKEDSNSDRISSPPRVGELGDNDDADDEEKEIRRMRMDFIQSCQNMNKDEEINEQTMKFAYEFLSNLTPDVWRLQVFSKIPQQMDQIVKISSNLLRECLITVGRPSEPPSMVERVRLKRLVEFCDMVHHRTKERIEAITESLKQNLTTLPNIPQTPSHSHHHDSTVDSVHINGFSSSIHRSAESLPETRRPLHDQTRFSNHSEPSFSSLPTHHRDSYGDQRILGHGGSGGENSSVQYSLPGDFIPSSASSSWMSKSSTGTSNIPGASEQVLSQIRLQYARLLNQCLSQLSVVERDLYRSTNLVMVTLQSKPQDLQKHFPPHPKPPPPSFSPFSLPSANPYAPQHSSHLTVNPLSSPPSHSDEEPSLHSNPSVNQQTFTFSLHHITEFQPNAYSNRLFDTSDWALLSYLCKPTFRENLPQFQKQISQLGLYIHQIRPSNPGSNGQFQAMAHQVYGGESVYPIVRFLIAFEILSNPAEYEQFFIGSPIDVYQYVSKLFKSNESDQFEFGDHITLQAFANYYESNVLLFTSVGSAPILIRSRSQQIIHSHNSSISNGTGLSGSDSFASGSGSGSVSGSASGSGSNGSGMNHSYYCLAYLNGKYYHSLVSMNSSKSPLKKRSRSEFTTTNTMDTLNMMNTTTDTDTDDHVDDSRSSSLSDFTHPNDDDDDLVVFKRRKYKFHSDDHDVDHDQSQSSFSCESLQCCYSSSSNQSVGVDSRSSQSDNDDDDDHRDDRIQDRMNSVSLHSRKNLTSISSFKREVPSLVQMCITATITHAELLPLLEGALPEELVHKLVREAILYQKLDDCLLEKLLIECSLDSLDFSNAHQLDYSCCAVISRAISHQQIHRVNLRNCARLQSDGFKTLLSSNGFESLIHIDLSGCTLLENSVLQLLGWKSPLLEAIHLNGCRSLTDSSIYDLLENCKRLRVLSINECPSVTDQAFISSQSPLQLHELDARECPLITDASIQNLSMRARENLRAIHLTSPSISDVAILALANFCPNLHTLEIFANHISDGALRQLGGSCRHLHTLAIPFMNISSAFFNDPDSIITIDRDSSDSPLTSEDSFHSSMIDYPHQHQKQNHDHEQKLFGAIQSLDMTRCLNVSDATLMGMVQSFGTLVDLNLSACEGISDYGIKALISPSSGGSLKSLNLSKCSKLTDLSIFHIAQYAPNLEKLSLYNCPEITDLAIQQLSLHCCKLKYLDLSSCEGLSDQAFRFFSRTGASLEVLCLEESKISDESLVNVLSNSPNLHTLKLAFCSQISDHTLHQLAISCPLLRKLDLSYCHSITVGAIQSTLKFWPNLNELNLRGCGSISNQFLEHPSVTVLNLSWCQNLEDSSVCHLVSGFPSLQFLDIAWCLKLTANSIHYVSQHCPSLLRLNWCTGS